MKLVFQDTTFSLQLLMTIGETYYKGAILFMHCYRPDMPKRIFKLSISISPKHVHRKSIRVVVFLFVFPKAAYSTFDYLTTLIALLPVR